MSEIFVQNNWLVEICTKRQNNNIFGQNNRFIETFPKHNFVMTRAKTID